MPPTANVIRSCAPGGEPLLKNRNAARPHSAPAPAEPTTNAVPHGAACDGSGRRRQNWRQSSMRASVNNATSAIQAMSSRRGLIDHSDAHTNPAMIPFANRTGTPWR